MKFFIAVVMGLMSGFMIYVLGAIAFADWLASPSSQRGFAFGFIAGGWVVSSSLLLRDARTGWKVAARGFLLGAAEWLAIFLAAVTRMMAMSAPDEITSFGVARGGLLTIVCLFMTLLCLTCFAVVHFWKREMKPENQER